MNLYGFVRNRPVNSFDVLGQAELSWKQYADNVVQQVAGGQRNFDEIFRSLMQQYLASDSSLPYFTDCQDDMENIWEAMNELVGGHYKADIVNLNHAQNLQDTPGYGDEDRSGDGSDISHFMAAASWAGMGRTAQDWFESGALDFFLNGTSPDLGPGDAMRDTAAAYLGVRVADIFDTWLECNCRRIAEKFASGEIKFSELFGGDDHNQVMRNLANRDEMNKWVDDRVDEFKEKLKK